MEGSELGAALRGLIRGEGVRRVSHALVVDGQDFTGRFFEVLEEEGFVPMRVEDVDIEPGERVPAFCVSDAVAHFGWVFWEVFHPGRRRKIFGSVARNTKGDWATVIGRGQSQRVFVNTSLKEEMDVDRPSSL